VLAPGGGTVTNAGSIVVTGAPYPGVGDAAVGFFAGDGTLTNLSGGTIAWDGTAAMPAVYAIYHGVVGNAGLLHSESTRFAAVSTDTATNAATGIITGQEFGILFATLRNDGTIGSGSVGVAALMLGHGRLDNGGQGVISGGLSAGVTPTLSFGPNIVGGTPPAGVDMGGDGLLTNEGRIGGLIGVYMQGGDDVLSNASTGVISGGVVGAGSFDTITNAGTINGSVSLMPGLGMRLVAVPGAVFAGSVNGGQTVAFGSNSSALELAPGNGTIADFSDFGTIVVDPGANWTIRGPKAALADNQVISGFAPGSTIELTGLNASYSSYGNGVLMLSDGTYLTFNGAFTGEHFVVNAGTDTDITVACFADGTRVLTERGEVAVEALRVGDRVAALSGRLARVVWIGRRRVAAGALVRVDAGAFGAGVPHRALWLSPDHAVLVDGVLVPVRYLVNGADIVAGEVAGAGYWHVELAAHAVLLAEGLACESYLDTGNRAGLAGAADGGARDAVIG
jgi:hypothetical protein